MTTTTQPADHHCLFCNEETQPTKVCQKCSRPLCDCCSADSDTTCNECEKLLQHIAALKAAASDARLYWVSEPLWELFPHPAVSLEHDELLKIVRKGEITNSDICRAVANMLNVSEFQISLQLRQVNVRVDDQRNPYNISLRFFKDE